jgi:hypothetical protein
MCEVDIRRSAAKVGPHYDVAISAQSMNRICEYNGTGGIFAPLKVAPQHFLLVIARGGSQAPGADGPRGRGSASWFSQDGSGENNLRQHDVKRAIHSVDLCSLIV